MNKNINISTKICHYCKKEFIPNRIDRIYCSEKCKWNFRNVKLGIKNLKIYGTKFPSKLTILLYRYSISKTKCENCGFIAMHSCQLDIHHIDGNHDNNDKNNLQVLCANCHRLVTFLNKQGIYSK